MATSTHVLLGRLLRERILVLDGAMGTVIQSYRLTEQDFRGLRRLAAACGSRFKLGLVVYDGELTVPFGKGLFAAPISALWG